MKFERVHLDEPPTRLICTHSAFYQPHKEWLQPPKQWLLLYFQHTNCLTLDTELYSVVPGDIAIISPGKRVSLSRIGDGCCFMSMLFTLPGESGTLARVPHLVPNRSDLRGEFSDATYSVVLTQGFPKAYCWSFLWQHAIFDEEVKPSTTLSKLDLLLSRGLSLNASKDNVASRLGVSVDDLDHALQGAGHQSFRRYMKQARLNRALHMLRQSDTPIKVIALELGYESVSHFSHSVKESTGRSPQDIRRLKGELD